MCIRDSRRSARAAGGSAAGRARPAAAGRRPRPPAVGSGRRPGWRTGGTLETDPAGDIGVSMAVSAEATDPADPVVRRAQRQAGRYVAAVSYTHLRAHETVLDLVCRLLL